MSSATNLGSCQNHGPFLGTLNIRCRIILRTQKGTIILTTTLRSLQRSHTHSFPWASHQSHDALGVETVDAANPVFKVRPTDSGPKPETVNPN